MSLRTACLPLVLVTASVAFSTGPAFGDVRSYAIGNSLTADVFHADGMGWFTSQRSIDYVGGFHINGSVGLADQWAFHLANQPPAFSEQGAFETAMASGSWNNIILQPFKNAAADEVAAAKNFVDLALTNPANKDAALFVYAPAPVMHDDGTVAFADDWVSPYAGGPVNSATNRAYFAEIHQAVRSAYPTQSVALVPAGDVWAAVAEKILAGEMPGVTDPAALYRDGLHASHLGQLTSAATWFAVTLKQDPHGLTVSPRFENVTQAQADVIFDTAWSVVQAQSDLTLVPEPMALGVLLVGMTVAHRRRRAM